MRVLLAAIAVMCCSAAPVQHKLWKTYLYFENTNPAVLKLPKPGINFNIYDAQQISEVVSEPMIKSPVPSPVLVKRLDTLPTEVEVPLDFAHQKIQKSPIPAPVLLRLEPVESPEDTVASVPGKNLASDEPVNNQVVSIGTPVVVAAAPEPLEAPEPPMPSLGVPFVGGQFHTQDELKQYSFGHWGGPSTRVETKDALGRIHGSFAYINPDGDVHMRKYAAAPTMGFKVAASDLPEDTPEVASLKAAHEQAHLAFLSFRKEIV